MASKLVKLASAFIRKGNSLLIATGAGMSADSGLSTYRGFNVIAS